MSNPTALIQKVWNYCNILRAGSCRFVWAIFSVLVLCMSAKGHAATLRVPMQYTNIQAAINFAAPGDVVLVAPGTYPENISFNGKAVTLISESGPTVTILDGRRAGPVVAFAGGDTRNAVLSGFTIRNGYSSFGSGVSLDFGSATIVSNIFESNSVVGTYFGAAIGGNGASPVIEKNTFRYNSAGTLRAAGVVSFVNSSSPRIANNVFHDNPGRAISLDLPDGTTPAIINNTIVRNQIGIQVSGSWGAVLNNIVVGNAIGVGADVGSAGWANNLVGGNQADYVGGPDQTGTNGNISGFPSFRCIRTGLTLDLRLLPGSPGIDAGNNSAPQLPAEDFDGHPRILAGQSNGVPVVDIGAFEFDPSEAIGFCSGPDIFCPPNADVECGDIHLVTVVVLHSTGDAMTVIWRLNGAAMQTNAIPPTGMASSTQVSLNTDLLLGPNVIEVTVTDGAQNVELCTHTVMVVDTTPPAMVCPIKPTVELNGATGAVVSFPVQAIDLCAGEVEVICRPSSGSVFPIGTTRVICVATDGVGNATPCIFEVTVLGPFSTKLAVLQEMEAAEGTVAGAPLRALHKAVLWLRRSIAAEHWLDETHLKKGEAAGVFWNEAAAVHYLRNLLRASGDPIADETVRGWIDRLVMVDRTLAELQINAAIEAGVKPRRIAPASRKLAQGDLAGNRRRPVGAILLYRGAWRAAVRAKIHVQNP
jgi:hypothetical protein